MLFSETEPAVSGCGETIWKEPKLCCRSARRCRCQDREERVSFGYRASDAFSIDLFAGKTRR